MFVGISLVGTSRSLPGGVFDASEDEAVPSSCSLENSEVLPNIAVPEVCGETSDPDAFPAFTKDESITHADSVVGTLNGDSRARGSHDDSDGIFSAPSNSPVTIDSLPCRICSGSGQYGFSSCVFCHGTGRDDSATSVGLGGPRPALTRVTVSTSVYGKGVGSLPGGLSIPDGR